MIVLIGSSLRDSKKIDLIYRCSSFTCKKSHTNTVNAKLIFYCRNRFIPMPILKV